MPGKYFTVTSGVYEGKIAAVDNKQEPAITKIGNVHALFFDEMDKPHLNKEGKHVSGIIKANKLSFIGFYD